ncbi:MAG: fatty acid desaturase family protein [Nannocystaceae bacterium]
MAIDLTLDNIWITFFLVVVIGHLHFVLSEVVVHHASHYNLFRKKRLHYQLDFLYALPFGLDLKVYRDQHLKHHHDFLEKGDDTCISYREVGFGPGADKHLAWLFWVQPLLGRATMMIEWSHFKESRRVQVFWLGMLSVVAATGMIVPFVLYHLIPRFYVCAVLLYWSEVTDHLRTHTGTRTNTTWWHNLVTKNDGYHAIHHLLPNVPWFNLPTAHALVDHDYDPSRGLLDVYQQVCTWKGPSRFPECF